LLLLYAVGTSQILRPIVNRAVTKVSCDIPLFPCRPHSVRYLTLGRFSIENVIDPLVAKDVVGERRNVLESEFTGTPDLGPNDLQSFDYRICSIHPDIGR
jgi:hypothetical protein